MGAADAGGTPVRSRPWRGCARELGARCRCGRDASPGHRGAIGTGPAAPSGAPAGNLHEPACSARRQVRAPDPAPTAPLDAGTGEPLPWSVCAAVAPKTVAPRHCGTTLAARRAPGWPHPARRRAGRCRGAGAATAVLDHETIARVQFRTRWHPQAGEARQDAAT